MAVTFAERVNLQKIFIGIFNAAPGATYSGQLQNVFEANGGSYFAVGSWLSTNASFNALYPATLSATEFAVRFLGSVGLADNAEAVAFVAGRAGPGQDRLSAILEALLVLNAATEGALGVARQNAVQQSRGSGLLRCAGHGQCARLGHPAWRCLGRDGRPRNRDGCQNSADPSIAA